jgi:hypothetical protein
MKSTEVYSQLRAELGPWFKSMEFRRAKGFLSWVRSQGTLQTVIWCQISQSGWEAYSGSQFTVEFQRSREPVVGASGGPRKRLAGFLSQLEREEARSIQNTIIASLPSPPANHPFLNMPHAISSHYLQQFKPVAAPYAEGHDIWFRYAAPAHVTAWAKFILRKLPQCLAQIEAPG